MTDEWTCQDAQERIVPFIDGELEPDEAQRVERHLAACRACSRIRDEHARLQVLLGELPEYRSGSIALRVAAARMRLRRRQRAAAWLSAAAAVLFAAGGTWLAVRTSSRQPEKDLIANLGVVEEIASLAEVGGVDLAMDLELVHAVYELSQEDPLKEF